MKNEIIFDKIFYKLKILGFLVSCPQERVCSWSKYSYSYYRIILPALCGGVSKVLGEYLFILLKKLYLCRGRKPLFSCFAQSKKKHQRALRSFAFWQDKLLRSLSGGKIACNLPILYGRLEAISEILIPKISGITRQKGEDENG